MPAIKRPSYTTPANRRAKWQKVDAQKNGWEDNRQDDDKPREKLTVNSGNEGTPRADKRKDKRNIHRQEDDGPNQFEKERNKGSGDLIDNKTGDTFWPAERILRETKTRYLIAWSPSSETGQKFRPTWEPKKNANDGLRNEWEGKKVQKKR
ncbi:hypothetical protein SLS56_012224 [Neofusicoccum ribis]|uniref:Chromo domain-containing protein n=1 Tax=Neofusicoccum ribis TaxID=45134 RepID=A0ABR3SA10_9PEZI